MATDPEQSTLLAYAADSSAAAVPATRGRRVGAVVVAVVLTAAVAGTRAAGSRGGFHSRAKAERLVALGGVDDNDEHYLSEIDDAVHKRCWEYERDDVYNSDDCTNTDDYFCAMVKTDWCNGTMCAAINATGCTTCDGKFGACLMKSLERLGGLCAELNDLREEGATKNYAADAARAAAASLAARKEAARRLSSADAALTQSATPTPAPSFFLFSEQPDCDIHGYCDFCAHSTTCNSVMEAAHHGNIAGVPAQNFSEHAWHAGQAGQIILNLESTSVCTDYGR